jgi:hypothetical protein
MYTIVAKGVGSGLAAEVIIALNKLGVRDLEIRDEHVVKPRTVKAKKLKRPRAPNGHGKSHLPPENSPSTLAVKAYIGTVGKGNAFTLKQLRAAMVKSGFGNSTASVVLVGMTKNKVVERTGFGEYKVL